MTNQEFKIGDVVKHKSGGPKMVIKAFEKDEVICEWINKESVPKEKAFDAVSLNLYVPIKRKYGSYYKNSNRTA